MIERINEKRFYLYCTVCPCRVTGPKWQWLLMNFLSHLHGIHKLSVADALTSLGNELVKFGHHGIDTTLESECIREILERINNDSCSDFDDHRRGPSFPPAKFADAFRLQGKLRDLVAGDTIAVRDTLALCPDGRCPSNSPLNDDHFLARWHTRRLTDIEIQELRHHLMMCQDCQQLLALRHSIEFLPPPFPQIFDRPKKWKMEMSDWINLDGLARPDEIMSSLCDCYNSRGFTYGFDTLVRGYDESIEYLGDHFTSYDEILSRWNAQRLEIPELSHLIICVHCRKALIDEERFRASLHENFL